MPEMKNQFTGGKMNKDLDERLVPKGEYRDAMNIQVSTSEGSEVGTVQNILGNSEIATNLNIGIINASCVGSIADEKNDKVYFFIIDATGNQGLPIKHMIVEYDVASNNSVPVFVTYDQSVLRFNPANLITGINIIDGMLFWTDGVNEPRKINIERCKLGTGVSGATPTLLINTYQNLMSSGQNASNIAMREEHVTVIKKAPLKAPFLDMLGERPGDSQGNINFNFASVENGDVVSIDITPVSSSTNNYAVGDILFVNENPTSSTSIFPIISPGYQIRLLVETINGSTHICRVVSIKGVIDFSQTSYSCDLDKSYQKLYELKFPRFAIRYKYEDGEYSSFGPFSEVAFIPGAWDEDVDKVSYMPNTGYNRGMENRLRELTLTKIIPRNIPRDVKQVDILYKESNSPAVYLVDEIKYDDIYWTKDFYTITKENIKSILPDNQILRPWDNVPRSAKAQELTGSRIVYANYQQNYDIGQSGSFRSILETSLQDRSDYFSGINFKSIKSIRDYQVGVVYTDGYNRQTPVLTDPTGALKVSKIDSSKTTQIQVVPQHQPPVWATHQKFYIKETSSEYYNLSLDRHFDAEDNNIWISFASNDRNKVDLETTLYLKKKLDVNEAETTFEKYKILDIKSEAPEFIKTRRAIIGRAYNNSSHPSANSTGGFNVFNGAGGNPVTGETVIKVTEEAVRNTLLNNFHTKHNSPNYDPTDNISSGGGASVNNPLFLRITFVGNDGVQYNNSDWHEVDNVTVEGEGDYLVGLKTSFQAVGNWTNSGGTLSNNSSDLISSIGSNSGSLVLEIAQDIIQNRSMFQGRFFVKIERNVGTQESLEGEIFSNLQVLATADCGYLQDFSKENPFDGFASAWNHTMPDYKQKNIDFEASGPANSTFVFTNQQGNSQQVLTTSQRQPDGKALPNNAYTGHSIWQKIYEHLEARGSRWVIDAAYACGEEPPGFQSGNFNSSSPTNLSTLYGGWNYDSANVGANPWTLLHNSTALGANINPLGNVTGLGHASQNDYEYFSEGQGVNVANNTIDISYVGPGETPGADTFFTQTQFPLAASSLNDYNNSGGDSAYDQYWKISDSPPNSATSTPTGVGTDAASKEADVFRRNLQVGAIIRFKNDPNNVLYKVKNLRQFWKYNYAESSRDGTYPFANSTLFSELFAATPNFTAYNTAKIFFNSAHFNRRLTFRIELECITSPGASIGTDGSGGAALSGYNPLIGDGTDETNIIPNHNKVSCPIEILGVGQTGTEDVKFPENPAVFETEPKEQTGLNIFYEATDTIPLQIDPSTIDDFIPIGSITDGDSGFAKVTTVSLTTGNVVHSSNVSNTYAVGDLIKYYRPDGFYTTAKVTNAPASAVLTLDLTNIKNNPVGLGWHNCYSFGNGVESNRIRDVFNSVTIDKGPKVSTTLEEGYEEEQRKYGLIYSGLYNSTSGLNNLNQFIQAEKITKDINPTYGSIQKLFTRNSDLLAFCEDKVLRILANKDAVFNADGNSQLTANNRVLGQTIPFSGEYGISTNPESFASESYRAYFTDKVRGAVMRLSKDGLTPISDAGMKDYFRDNLKDNAKLIGSYDDKKDEYNITLPDTQRDNVTGVTVSFNEKVRGWVSFKSFVPQNAISGANEYFSVNAEGKIWKHHDDSQPRNTFYNAHNPSDYSSVTVLLNQSPSIVKSFNTINYEGSKSKVDIFTTDANTGLTDGQYYNLSASDGWYLESLFTDKENGHISEFIEKEGKWFNYIKGEEVVLDNQKSIIINADGSSSFDQASFAVQGLGVYIANLGN